MISKKNIRMFSVFWIILSSGTVYYTLYNMKLSMIILLLSSIICASPSGMHIRLALKNRQVIVLFLTGILFNTLINIGNGFLIEDFIIILVKLFSVALVASSLTKDEYIEFYIKGIVFIAAVSLVCWCLVYIGFKLPFYTTVYTTDRYFGGTFYYLYNQNESTFRNKGIFWEPGYYQAFLNLGILFSLYRVTKGADGKKEALRICILGLTVLTTQSSTGYLCLAIVLAYAMLFVYSPDKNKGFLKRNIFRIIVILAIVALIFVEQSMSIMGTKIIEGGGSYTTRMTDTVACFKAALDYPITGIGWFSKIFREVTMQYGAAYNNSSCLGAIFVRFGFPLAFVFLWGLYVGIKNMMELNNFQAMVAFVLVLIFYATESIYITPVFLMFFVRCRNNDYLHNKGAFSIR